MPRILGGLNYEIYQFLRISKSAQHKRIEILPVPQQAICSVVSIGYLSLAEKVSHIAIKPVCICFDLFLKFKVLLWKLTSRKQIAFIDI
jgi:hypothetical protein